MLALTAAVLLQLPVTGISQEDAPDLWPRPALDAAKATRHRLLDIAGNGQALVAVGEQGLIVRSSDGQNWRQQASPVDSFLTRVVFADDELAWALGYDAAILQSGDAGQSWTVRHYDSDSRALFDLIQTGKGRLLAVGAYGLMLESADQGQTWSPVDNLLSELGMHLYAIVRVSDQMLFVAGERGLAARSPDNGASWEILDFPYAGSLFGAHVMDGQLWVHGMRGHLYVTDALGQCATTPGESWDSYDRITIDDPEQVRKLGWRQLDTPTQESLFGSLETDGRLLLFGVNGTMLLARGDEVLALDSPADETLSAGAVHEGRMHLTGRRGLVTLDTSR